MLRTTQSEVSRLWDEVAQYKKDMEHKDAEVVNAVERHTEVILECIYYDVLKCTRPQYYCCYHLLPSHIECSEA